MKYINDDKPRKAMPLLLTWWKRHKLARAFYALDSRMLADIGIAADEIEEAIDRTYPRVTLMGFFTGLGEAIMRARINHIAARELSHIDDRMLSDIGLTRGDILAISAGFCPQRKDLVCEAIEVGFDASFKAEAINDDLRHAVAS